MNGLTRNATTADVPQLLEIVNHAIVHTTANYSLRPHTLAEWQLWFDGKTQREEPVLVYESNGRILGFATYGRFREKAGYDATVEHSVYVAPDTQGKGIGRTLMAQLIPTARNQGKHLMIGCIDAQNEESLRFHDRLGFERSGVIREAARKFDRWLDLAFVQLKL